MKKKPTKQQELECPTNPAMLKDMKYFYRHVDWREWWEEYFLSIKPDSSYTYKTVASFVSAKAKNNAQREFLSYYLGPVIEDDERAAKYAFVKPADWKQRRDTGGWYTDKNIETIGAAIRINQNVLDRMRMVGDKVVLPFMAGLVEMQRQLHAGFKGQLFVEGNSTADNLARANAYFRMYRQLLEMLASVNDIFAKTNGVNFDDMGGFAALVTSAMANYSTKSAETDVKMNRVLDQITKMTLVKAARFDLPLPDDIGAAVIEGSAEPVISPPDKKKRNGSVQ